MFAEQGLAEHSVVQLMEPLQEISSADRSHLACIRETLAFGPVPSRRLGTSLGVNVVPLKICSYSCIYCQLGRTLSPTVVPRCYFTPENIAKAVSDILDGAGKRPDYITLIGHGEPTLAENLGRIRSSIEQIWDGRIALLTNGSLLWKKDVCEAALAFDAVMPTISAGDETLFRMIHRPHPSLSFEKVIGGMTEFADSFDGELFVETMLLGGINDSDETLERIRVAIEPLNPDCVHLMAPTRPPAESWIECPSRIRISAAMRIIPNSSDMTEPESSGMPSYSDEEIGHLIGIASMHPLRDDQAVALLASKGLSESEARNILEVLVASSRLDRKEYAGKMFYRASRSEGNG
jgi:wyosine [tRNA(Phe)-imidazoG37] synthetase (radical SAM superfamily)